MKFGHAAAPGPTTQGGFLPPTQSFVSSSPPGDGKSKPDRPFEGLGKTSISLFGGPGTYAQATPEEVAGTPHGPVQGEAFKGVPILEQAAQVVGGIANIPAFALSIPDRIQAGRAWEQNEGADRSKWEALVANNMLSQSQAEAMFRRQLYDKRNAGKPQGLFGDLGAPSTDYSLGGQVFGGLGAVMSIPQRWWERTTGGNVGSLAGSIARGDFRSPVDQRMDSFINATDAELNYGQGDYGHPELIDIRNRLKSGQITKDEAFDELIVAGFGVSNPVGGLASIFNMVTSDPTNILSAGGAFLAKASTKAALTGAKTIFSEIGTDAVKQFGTKLAERGIVATDANFVAHALRDATMRPLVESALQKGNPLVKFMLLDAPAIQRAGTVVNNVLGNFSFFGGDDIGKATERQFSNRLASGVINGYGASNYRSLVARASTVLGDDVAEALQDGFDRAAAQIGVQVGNEQNIRHIRVTQALDGIDNPTSHAMGSARRLGGDIAGRAQDRVERTKFRVVPLRRGAEGVEQALRSARTRAVDQVLSMAPGKVDREAARKFVNALSEDELSLLDFQHYGAVTKDLIAARGAAAAEGGFDQVDRVTFIGPRQLTRQTLKDLDKAVRKGQATLVRGMVERFDDLYRIFDLEQTDELLLKQLRDTIDQLVDHTPQALTDIDQLPTALREWAGKYGAMGYHLGLRPDDDTLMRPLTDKAGRIVGVNPWVDLVDEKTARQTITRLKVMQRGMFNHISGSSVVRDAQHRFIRMGAERYGLPETALEGLFSKVMKTASHAETTPRGLSHTEMYRAALDTRLPKGMRGRMTERDFAELVLEAHEGSLSKVGLTQKFTGKVKSTAQMVTGNNFIGQLAERIYPLTRFKINPFFQYQEMIETPFFMLLRGRLPMEDFRRVFTSSGRKEINDEVERTIWAMGLVERKGAFYSGDMAEHSMLTLHGNRAINDSLRRNGIIDRLGRLAPNVHRMKEWGVARSFQYEQAKAVSRAMREASPESWANYADWLALRSGARNDRQAVTNYLYDTIAKADPDSTYAKFGVHAFKPDHLGARARISTSLVRGLIYGEQEGKGVKWGTLLSEIADGKRPASEVSEALTRIGADPVYVQRALDLVTFPKPDDFYKAFVKLGRTQNEVDAIRASGQLLARMQGISEHEMLSRMYAAAPASLTHLGEVKSTTMFQAIADSFSARGKQVVERDDPRIAELAVHGEAHLPDLRLRDDWETTKVKDLTPAEQKARSFIMARRAREQDPTLGLPPSLADDSRAITPEQGAAIQSAMDRANRVLPAAGGETPLEPGMIRAYHYTSAEGLDGIRAEGLRLDRAIGETYGEPNRVWFSTSRPTDERPFVEVHLRPEEINGEGGFWGRAPTQDEIDAFNERGGNFNLTNDVPADRIVTHNEPWMHTYRQFVADGPKDAATFRKEFGNWLNEKPDGPYGDIRLAVERRLEDLDAADESRALQAEAAGNAGFGKLPAAKFAKVKSPGGQQVHAFGPVEGEEWFDMLSNVMGDDVLREKADWYIDMRRGFLALAENDPQEAARLITLFGVSQLNTSPVDGMRFISRALAAYRRGERLPIDQTFSGLNSAAVKRLLEEGALDEAGLGQKLVDFIDSLLGRKTRTAGVHGPDELNPWGPAAADIWAKRDLGYIDQKMSQHIGRLYGGKAVWEDGVGFHVTTRKGEEFLIPASKVTGGAPTELEYDHIVEFYNQRAQDANARNFLDRNDWSAAEMQALGWFRAKFAMGDRTGSPLDAFHKNVSSVTGEVAPSPSSALHDVFPGQASPTHVIGDKGFQRGRITSGTEVSDLLYEGERLLSRLQDGEEFDLADTMAMRAKAFNLVQDEWGGITFDPRTGKQFRPGAVYHGSSAPEESIARAGINRGDWVDDPALAKQYAGPNGRVYRTLPRHFSGGMEKAPGWWEGPRVAARDVEVLRDLNAGSFEPLIPGAPRPGSGPFASSIGQTHSIPIADAADQAKFDAAYDAFVAANEDLLRREDLYVGVFRNEDTGMVEFDVNAIVDTERQAEALQLAGERTGGAYDWWTGNGVYAPVVGPQVDGLPPDVARAVTKDIGAYVQMEAQKLIGVDVVSRYDGVGSHVGGLNPNVTYEVLGSPQDAAAYARTVAYLTGQENVPVSRLSALGANAGEGRLHAVDWHVGDGEVGATHAQAEAALVQLSRSNPAVAAGAAIVRYDDGSYGVRSIWRGHTTPTGTIPMAEFKAAVPDATLKAVELDGAVLSPRRVVVETNIHQMDSPLPNGAHHLNWLRENGYASVADQLGGPVADRSRLFYERTYRKHYAHGLDQWRADRALDPEWEQRAGPLLDDLDATHGESVALDATRGDDLAGRARDAADRGDALFQRHPRGTLGAIAFDAHDNRARIFLNAKRSNPDTLLHELSHQFAEQSLDPSGRKAVLDVFNEEVLGKRRPRVIGPTKAERAAFDADVARYNKELDAYEIARKEYDDAVAAATDKANPVTAIVSDLRATEKRNSLSVEKRLTKLEAQGIDVGPAMDKVEDWRGMERSDFGDAEEWADARTEAWDELIDEIEALDISPWQDNLTADLVEPTPPKKPAPLPPERRGPAPVPTTTWTEEVHEWFAKQMTEWARGGDSPARQLDPIFAYYGKYLKTTTAGVKMSPSVKAILDEITARPVARASAANVDEMGLMNLMLSSADASARNARDLIHFRTNRSWIERSLNHPYFGMYPLSYMWGKVLPELAEFLVNRPFGMRAPMVAYNTVADIYRAVMLQQENDPELRKYLADNEPALRAIALMVPGVPWDLPVNAPNWLRRITEAIATQNQRVLEGRTNPDGTPASLDLTKIDAPKIVSDTAGYALNPVKGFGDIIDSGLGIQKAAALGINQITGQPVPSSEPDQRTLQTPALTTEQPVDPIMTEGPLQGALNDAATQLENALSGAPTP